MEIIEYSISSLHPTTHEETASVVLWGEGDGGIVAELTLLTRPMPLGGRVRQALDLIFGGKVSIAFKLNRRDMDDIGAIANRASSDNPDW